MNAAPGGQASNDEENHRESRAMTSALAVKEQELVVIDRSRIGDVVGPVKVSWTSRDTMLYAIALGVGSDDPTLGLQYTTENSSGISQEVLGTYAAVIAQNAALPRNLGDVPPANVLHAGQRIKIHRALPPSGNAHVRQATTAIYDKGRGALAVIESAGVDDEGRTLFEASNFSYIRGAGGFGGERGVQSEWDTGGKQPDERLTVITAPNQALVYRLCGDRNPLHSDPVFASRAGFKRPILHGLVTLGLAARTVTEGAGLPSTLEGCELAARFTRSVYPGDTLHLDVWWTDDGAQFVGHTGDGSLALSEGSLHVFDAAGFGK